VTDTIGPRAPRQPAPGRLRGGARKRSRAQAHPRARDKDWVSPLADAWLGAARIIFYARSGRVRKERVTNADGMDLAGLLRRVLAPGTAIQGIHLRRFHAVSPALVTRSRGKLIILIVPLGFRDDVLTTTASVRPRLLQSPAGLRGGRAALPSNRARHAVTLDP